MRAALVQAHPTLGNVEKNAERAALAVRESDADLVVLPELFLSGYALGDLWRENAQDLDGPALATVADACQETGRWCVVGTPRHSEVRGVIHNSAILLSPRGVEGWYDKLHLPTFSVFEEGLHFGPGHDLPIFDTPFGRLGLNICYDLFFPEVTKALALAGADILVTISASPVISRAYFEAIFAARAIETTSWLLYTNLVGRQDQVPFWGGAQAWGPRGDRKVRGPDHEEATTYVDVDLAEVEEARLKRPVLRDTRGEVLDLLRRTR